MPLSSNKLAYANSRHIIKQRGFECQAENLKKQAKNFFKNIVEIACFF